MRHSTTYTILFAAAVCVVCAVLVSSSAVSLSERQSLNAKLDKYKNVLYAAGLAEPSERLGAEETARRFERVRTLVVELESGEIVDDVDWESYDPEKAAADPVLGRPAPENPSAIKRLPKYQIIYHVVDESAEPELVVLPIKGYGLWSTLYGFLALERDTKTIRGITYYQHAETAGLGGEVDNPAWKRLWKGRLAYDEDWRPAIVVIKGPAGPPAADPYRVDGLSGATITSRGVTNMLEFWLGENGFAPYLRKFREQHAGN